MLGIKERREMKRAKARYDVEVLTTLREANERRMAELRGPGYCTGCVRMLERQGVPRDEAIRRLRGED